MKMTEFNPFEPKWFRELKKNREDFSDVNNMIESAKFKFDRDFNTPKWIIGIGFAILFSAGISNLSTIQNPLIQFLAFWGFIFSAIAFGIALFLILAIDSIQKIAMAYLYREKDKQDKEKKN